MAASCRFCPSDSTSVATSTRSSLSGLTWLRLSLLIGLNRQARSVGSSESPVTPSPASVPPSGLSRRGAALCPSFSLVNDFLSFLLFDLIHPLHSTDHSTAASQGERKYRQTSPPDCYPSPGSYRPLSSRVAAISSNRRRERRSPRRSSTGRARSSCV